MGENHVLRVSYLCSLARLGSLFLDRHARLPWAPEMLPQHAAQLQE